MWPVSPGNLLYFAPREGLSLTDSLGVPRLGLNGIHLPKNTGLATDRSIGTLVPTGLTVAPGPMMGTLVANGRMRRVMGPKCPATPGHVENDRSAARATFSSTITGARVGPAHVASQ